ncbi:hypothetical protein WA026_020522 [Henosepilachna vigintioctopunctata]|uniref:Uncharacterized protein n=1 Tax=Henosepilachna vigintioctopunctata TaxID=420089 RepID=A0AAW1VG48_9CUCU
MNGDKKKMEEVMKKADKIKENFEFLTAQGYNVSEFILQLKEACSDKPVKKDSKTSQKKQKSDNATNAKKIY